MAAEKLGHAPFEENDEEAMVTLAAFAAAAIDGARLMAAERERGAALADAAAARERERQREETLSLIIAAQEDERARVARDLHDEIGQALTGVLLGLHLVDTAMRAEPVDVQRAAMRIGDVRELVAEALRQVRRLASDLRPTVLDDLGLSAALERLVADVGGRHGVRVVLHSGGVDARGRLPAPVETVAYRVVQESLTNVVRHAGASRVSVEVHAQADRVLVRVVDDGAGFDVGASGGSLGLRGMAERAQLAGRRLRNLPGGFGDERGAGDPCGRVAVSQIVRVALCDDHRVVRSGLRRILEAEPGVEVAGEAGTAQMAVAVTAAEGPDVMVMDIGLPGVDGIEATRRVRRASPATKVLVTSNWCSRSARSRRSRRTSTPPSAPPCSPPRRPRHDHAAPAGSCPSGSRTSCV
jgi:CheY-like chemotaxis protein